MALKEIISVVLLSFHFLFIFVELIIGIFSHKKISSFCKNCNEPIYAGEELEHKCSPYIDILKTCVVSSSLDGSYSVSMSSEQVKAMSDLIHAFLDRQEVE